MRIGLLGVPFNSNGTAQGVALAPAALRARGLVDALRRVADVHDGGDIWIESEGPTRDPASAVIAPLGAAAMSRAVAVAVGALFDDDRFPLVIGGDCPILFGCLAAAEDSLDRVNVLYIDGHEDAYPPTASTTGELADMDLGLILGRSRGGLPLPLEAAIPTLSAGLVAILGARDAAEAARSGVASLRNVVGFFADDVMLGADPRRVIAQAQAQVGVLSRAWLHVDLDVLSTTALAAVDYPQPGGIDWPALQIACVAALGSTPHPLGWDLTIYNPELDPGGAGADQIIEFLAQILGTLADS